MTLTEFLLARITEDEARLPALHGMPPHGAALTRAYAECEAKRRIVDWARYALEPDAVLLALALPYADHPDYREVWLT